MKELDLWRDKIDKIDDQLVKLLNKRAGFAQKIAATKSKNGVPVFLPARENEIIKKIANINKGPLSAKALEGVFREVFSASRSVERAICVASLGPAGSFSHLAALKYFGSSSDHKLVPGIDQVFAEVEKGNADYGIAPIENSIDGTVGLTQDLLTDSKLNIYAEAYFDIHMNIISKAKRLEDVKTLYTLDVPLGQCRRWVLQNLPGVKIVDAVSSSEAARLASRDKSSAAIGARQAAEIYKLRILARKIEETQDNQTRFLIISKGVHPPSGNDKTSILFGLNDQSGALHKVLRPFAQRGVNMSKIQSRPKPDSKWEYLFFLDIEGHLEETKVAEALTTLSRQTAFLKILGSYPNGRV